MSRGSTETNEEPTPIQETGEDSGMSRGSTETNEKPTLIQETGEESGKSRGSAFGGFSTCGKGKKRPPDTPPRDIDTYLPGTTMELGSKHMRMDTTEREIQRGSTERRPTRATRKAPDWSKKLGADNPLL